MIFAVSEAQLKSIIADILPALKAETKLWIAHPKVASKISTNLNRDASWTVLHEMNFETVELISLDHVWQAFNFKMNEETEVEVDEIKATKKSRKALVA